VSDRRNFLGDATLFSSDPSFDIEQNNQNKSPKGIDKLPDLITFNNYNYEENTD
jgi:hypothetical protein